jgi:hypothetical protein
MKIIDQTPFFKENGEISLVDRGKAIMQFGLGWIKEIEAQKSVIPVFEKILDRNFTLLRNVAPPGLDVRIPFILVGSTGVFVMDVTALQGMFRAKGDQWGTVEGSNYKPQNPNLLTRTEKLARAVQLYLQRQGISEVRTVEAVLLCANPDITIDSLRPIIRVVMRDALERFIVSISQARVDLSPDIARLVVKRLQTAASPPAESLDASAIAEPEQPAQGMENPPSTASMQPFGGTASSDSLLIPPMATGQEEIPPASTSIRRSRGIKKGQILVLIIMFVLWCLIVAAFAYFVSRDFIY